MLSLPPLTFGWQTFDFPESVQWSQPEMGKLNPQQPWQYLDLHGEGISGSCIRTAAHGITAPRSVIPVGSDDVNAGNMG